MKGFVAQSCPTLCDSMYSSLPGSSVHEIFQARILEWVFPFPSQRDLPNPGIEPRSPTLQSDSLPAEPQWKPKHTGVGSLPLLQGIFSTQGSNTTSLVSPALQADSLALAPLDAALFAKVNT